MLKGLLVLSVHWSEFVKMAQNQRLEKTCSFGNTVSHMVPNECNGSAMNTSKLVFSFWSKIALLKVPSERVHCDDK